MCIQRHDNGRDWFFEPSMSYTRKQSIAYMIEGTNLTWRKWKTKFNWRCSKVEVTFKEINHES